MLCAAKEVVSVIQTSQLMLYREIIAVCSQIHTKHIHTLCGQNVEFYIKIKFVPRSKHTPSRLYKPVNNAVQNVELYIKIQSIPRRKHSV